MRISLKNGCLVDQIHNMLPDECKKCYSKPGCYTSPVNPNCDHLDLNLKSEIKKATFLPGKEEKEDVI